MNVHDTLMKAADLIEERGWVQGPDGWIVDGPYCALGAIGAAADVHEVSGSHFFGDILALPATPALATYLGHDSLGADGENVYRWNDADDRTAAEVVEVLRAAAAVSLTREPAREVAAQPEAVAR